MNAREAADAGWNRQRRANGRADEAAAAVTAGGNNDMAFADRKAAEPRPNAHDCNAKAVLLHSGRGYPLQKIEWLWPGWMAAGKLHLLAGAKATGKSTIAFDLMARLSVGAPWPDGSPAPLGDVLIWSGEDGIGDTIMPRFVAAGGDIDRIYPVRHVIANGETRLFDPAADIPALIEAAAQFPNLRLAVIDPIVLVLPAGSDSHKNTETRRGLQPLVDFAEQRGVALVGITHFTKGTADRDPVERVTGSLAFGALPRCVWGASADDDGFQRRLVRIASNIGPTGGGIEYTLHQEPIAGYEDLSAQRIAWGAKLTGPAAELLSAKKQSAQAEASAFLRDFLAAGSFPHREVKEAAEAHGHSWGTIRLAQKTLGIKPQKLGKAWCWGLPPPPSTFAAD
jgi:putative DNA primase/helicase